MQPPSNGAEMSGKQEKRKRRQEGISVAARRDQQDFARLVMLHREARAERRAACRVRNRRVGAGIGLAVIAAALAAAVVGAVI